MSGDSDAKPGFKTVGNQVAGSSDRPASGDAERFAFFGHVPVVPCAVIRALQFHFCPGGFSRLSRNFARLFREECFERSTGICVAVKPAPGGGSR